MVDIVRKNSTSAWTLGKFFTIDEMMIRYKETYCPTRQYVPKKPKKLGVRV